MFNPYVLLQELTKPNSLTTFISQHLNLSIVENIWQIENAESTFLVKGSKYYCYLHSLVLSNASLSEVDFSAMYMHLMNMQSELPGKIIDKKIDDTIYVFYVDKVSYKEMQEESAEVIEEYARVLEFIDDGLEEVEESDVFDARLENGI